ncbi:MAG: hypothetical protein HY961_19785 [Ignavibacteriae bacterium]|nr:hypothetical protein [Ignavibacteriota bacterium]
MKKRRAAFWVAGFILLSVVGLHLIVTQLLVEEDTNGVATHYVIENWAGSKSQFDEAILVCEKTEGSDVATIIFEHLFQDTLSRREVIEAAWDAGFDTSHLKLIPVPQREPKTLNIASAVIDSASAWGWTHLTLVTAQLHTARSKKAYQYHTRNKSISVSVVGVPFLGVSSRNWFLSWEGYETVFEELTKTVYYAVMVY